MKDNSGKPLEKLVREIEQHLLPSGFGVQANEKIFDDDGQQIAEFDLIISGNLGSSCIRWLIECRDRPSEGAAPGSWIQQLVGRKEQFKFDKVFAVSTSGFSPSAIAAAESGNIILRTVETVAEIHADFQIIGLTFEFEETEVVGPMSGELEDPKQTIGGSFRGVPLIKRAGELLFQPLGAFIAKNRQHPPVLDHGLELLYFHCEGRIEVLLDGVPIKVKNFRVPVQIKPRILISKALFGRVYSEGERTIWAEASFEADSPNGKIKSRMQIFKHPDGQTSARFFNDEVPDGIYLESLQIFGWRDPTEDDS